MEVGLVERSWGATAGDSVEWDIDLKEPMPYLKLGLRYCFDRTDAHVKRTFTDPHVLHLSIDDAPPLLLNLEDTGGWNHSALHSITLPVLSPGSHTFRLTAPADKSDVNLDCAVYYQGEPPAEEPGPLRPMRLASSANGEMVVCAGPTAKLTEKPAAIASTFQQLRDLMKADYGAGPHGPIFVHFADPAYWEFSPIELGFYPSPGDRKGQNSNAARNHARVVKNYWGIYVLADDLPYDRPMWCWAVAEYFGSRDLPAWFRHSTARVSGLLDWLPALDSSTTASEDRSAAELVDNARRFLQSDTETERVETVHAAVREKYGADVFRKFWQLVLERKPPLGPMDKHAALALLSKAAGGEDVTPLYRRWKGFATEGPVDPLVVGAN